MQLRFNIWAFSLARDKASLCSRRPCAAKGLATGRVASAKLRRPNKHPPPPGFHLDEHAHEVAEGMASPETAVESVAHDGSPVLIVFSPVVMESETAGLSPPTLSESTWPSLWQRGLKAPWQGHWLRRHGRNDWCC